MPRKDLVTYPKKVGYRKHTGMVAWLLHRITGVIIGLYFIMHILSVSGTVPAFSSVTSLTAVKILFLASFTYHAFNGVRIILMEFADGSDRKKFSKYFAAAVFVAVVITVIGSIPMFG